MAHTTPNACLANGHLKGMASSEQGLEQEVQCLGHIWGGNLFLFSLNLFEGGGYQGEVPEHTLPMADFLRFLSCS